MTVGTRLFPLMMVSVIVSVFLFSGCGLDQKTDGGNQGDDSSGEAPQLTQEEQARREALGSAYAEGYLILVNKEHALGEEYKPDDLVAMEYYVPDRPAEARFMRQAAAAAFSQLVEAAKAQGLEIRMTTAYRSYSLQKTLYDNYVASEGLEEASRFSAKPGESEHQTGLAVDVSSPSVGYQLTQEYGDTEEGQYLVEHAYEFGFILRYPDGMEDITGYLYEPWHLRYVGTVAAKEIHDQGVTLEEYLEENADLFDSQ